ncbi:MAG: tetratricopeptide repeat protein [Pontibacterium sp.]
MDESELLEIISCSHEVKCEEPFLYERSTALKKVLRCVNPEGSPLFAAFIGQQFNDDQSAHSQTQERFLTAILRREYQERWKAKWQEKAPLIGEDCPSMRIAILANIIDGVYASTAKSTGLVTSIDKKICDQALTVNCSTIGDDAFFTDHHVPPIRPDILKEWFVLSAFNGVVPVKEIMNIAWRIAPKQTAIFISQTVQDFSSHRIVNELLSIQPPTKEAETWLSKVSLSIYRCISSKEHLPSTILDALERFSNEGNLEATYFLGQIYLQGVEAPPNPEKAFNLMLSAASSGLREAIYNVGYMYFEGIGTERSKEEAFEYFTAAAHMGHGSALYNLSLMYGQGDPVEEDYDKAKKLLKKASKLGIDEATDLLEELIANEESAKETGRAESQMALLIDSLTESYSHDHWCDRLVFKSDWRLVPRDSAKRMLRLIINSYFLDEYPLQQDFWDDVSVECIRATPLDSHLGIVIIDIQILILTNAERVILSAALGSERAVLLEGSAATIFKINKNHLQLDTQNTPSYLRFFFAYTWNKDDEPFQLLTSKHDIELALKMEEGIDLNNPEIVPLTHVEGTYYPDFFMVFESLLLKGLSLLKVRIKVFASGEISLMSSQEIAVLTRTKLRERRGACRATLL